MRRISLVAILWLASGIGVAQAQFTPGVTTSFDTLQAGDATGFLQQFVFLAGQSGPASVVLDLDKGSFDYTGYAPGDVIGSLLLPIFVDNPFPIPDVSGDITGRVDVTAVTGDTMQGQAVVETVDPALVSLLGLLGIPDPTGQVAFFVEYVDGAGDTGGTVTVTDAGVLPTGGSLTIDLELDWDTTAPIFVHSPAGGALVATTTFTSVDFQTSVEVENFTLIGGGVVESFIRGDVSGDGQLQINDAVALLSYLFSSGPTPTCLDAADANDNGAIAIDDPVSLLAYLFQGASLPAPNPDCGTDTTMDGLDCQTSSAGCP